jgi:hypothetical protein
VAHREQRPRAQALSQSRVQLVNRSKWSEVNDQSRVEGCVEESA